MTLHTVFGDGALTYIPGSYNDGDPSIVVGNLFEVNGDDWTVEGGRVYIPFTGGAGIVLTVYLFDAVADFPSTPLQTETVTLTNAADWYSVDFDPVAFPDGAQFVIGYTFLAFPDAYEAVDIPTTDPIQAADGSNLFLAGGMRGRFRIGAGSVTSTNDWYGIDMIADEDVVIPLAVSVGPDRSTTVGGSISLTATGYNGAGTRIYAWASSHDGDFSAPTAATTNYSPNEAGTHVLSCTVTDDTGAAYDEVVVFVAVDPAVARSASPATVDLATDWGLTPSSGMTTAEILTDTDGGTYLTSLDTAVGQPLVVTFDAIPEPLAGQDLILNVTCDDTTAGGATLTAKLYEGVTLISTAATRDIPAGDASQPVRSTLAFVFPAADIADIADWGEGLTVRLEATI